MAIRFTSHDKPAPKSTAARIDVPTQKVSNPGKNVAEAGHQALPVDTNPPKPFNKTEYQKTYMADLRTIKRLGLQITVKEWRKPNGK